MKAWFLWFPGGKAPTCRVVYHTLTDSDRKKAVAVYEIPQSMANAMTRKGRFVNGSLDALIEVYPPPVKNETV